MFDTLRFLRDNFHDQEGVIRLIAQHCGDPLPERAAVAKWFQRASIPGYWLPVLIVAAEAAAGRPVDFRKYLQRPMENDIFA